MINFVQIGPEDIDRVWGHCLPLLHKSFDRLINDYNEDDIKEQILAEVMQLWLAIDGSEILGCAVTIIMDHPKSRILNIINLGGNDLPSWINILDVVLSGFAISNGCKAYRAWTRKGFSRFVPGLIEDGAIYVKLLGDK